MRGVELMYKIVLFNEDMEIVDVLRGIHSFTPYIDGVEFTDQKGKGELNKINGAYIVIDANRDETTVTEQEVIDFYRELKVKELSEACRESIFAGFEFEGEQYDYDLKAQADIANKMVLLLLDEHQSDMRFKPKGQKEVKIFTREEFIELYKVGETHKHSKQEKYWALRDYVMTAHFKKLEELKRVTWDDS